jgi:glycosyltransferase involved in cell wall biosynthesis
MGQDFICLLAGDGPLRGEVQRKIERSALEGCVYLLGTRQDVVELLRLADVFVMTSLWEGLPIALLEAMSVGKPVVATSVGGIPNVVIHGENGLLVPPGGGPSTMASAILYLLDHPQERQRLGSRARATIEERYSMKAMASKLLAEYESAYSRKRI